MSAFLPTSRLPTSSSSASAAAASMVMARMTSSAVIRSCEQPMVAMSHRFCVGLEPGLKSVLSATRTPASSIRRAGA